MLVNGRVLDKITFQVDNCHEMRRINKGVFKNWGILHQASGLFLQTIAKNKYILNTAVGCTKKSQFL